jgi:hypothetical protein
LEAYRRATPIPRGGSSLGSDDSGDISLFQNVRQVELQTTAFAGAMRGASATTSQIV